MYCSLILALTAFFIHQKTKRSIWSITAFGSGVLIVLILFDFLPHVWEESTHDLMVCQDVLTGTCVFESSTWPWGRLGLMLLFILAGFLVNAFSEMVLLPRIQFLNKLWPAPQKPCHEKEHIHYHLLPTSTGCSAVACLFLCAFFDGFRLASSALLDFQTALKMGLGLLFHLIPESVTVLSIGLSAGFSKKALLKMSLLFCGSLLLGYQAVFGLSHVGFLKMMIFPFAVGLFLYVSCIHLIPMAFKLKQKKALLIGMLFCFALLVLLRPILGDH